VDGHDAGRRGCERRPSEGVGMRNLRFDLLECRIARGTV
jgi:hypothetical protein